MSAPLPAAYPKYLECDCCASMVDRVWAWRYYGFGLRLFNGRRTYFDAGAWAFCVYCRPLFEARELDVLVARVVSLNHEATAALLAPVYEVLAQCVHGECLTWEEGQPYAHIWPKGSAKSR